MPQGILCFHDTDASKCNYYANAPYNTHTHINILKALTHTHTNEYIHFAVDSHTNKLHFQAYKNANPCTKT